MVQLDPDAFLTQLTRILERSRGQGTLYVTFKRCAQNLSHHNPSLRSSLGARSPPAGACAMQLTSYCTRTLPADAGKEGKRVNEVDPAECRCLVRAVGAKQKISAMISAKDHRR